MSLQLYQQHVAKGGSPQTNEDLAKQELSRRSSLNSRIKDVNSTLYTSYNPRVLGNEVNYESIEWKLNMCRNSLTEAAQSYSKLLVCSPIESALNPLLINYNISSLLLILRTYRIIFDVLVNRTGFFDLVSTTFESVLESTVYFSQLNQTLCLLTCNSFFPIQDEILAFDYLNLSPSIQTLIPVVKSNGSVNAPLISSDSMNSFVLVNEYVYTLPQLISLKKFCETSKSVSNEVIKGLKGSLFSDLCGILETCKISLLMVYEVSCFLFSFGCLKCARRKPLIRYFLSFNSRI